MDIQKSITLIEENGSDLEKARFQRIYYDKKPEPGVIQAVSELQNRDGGFPFEMIKGNLSTIDNTLTALWWMDELGMLGTITAEKTFSFLLASQKDDGGWDEDPAITMYDLPPWVNPGDLKTRLYLSTYSAYWLAAGGNTSSPAFSRALDFIHQNQGETGKVYGYLHSTWIAAAVFLMAGGSYSSTGQQCLDYLSELSLSQWEASQVVWAADCLSRAGLSQDHAFMKRCLAELLQRQRDDGSWASEDGDAFAVGTTLQAIKVLRFYRII